MSSVYLIEGPVGAGKSTFASTLAFEKKAARFNLDEWMVTLFRPDRPEEGFLEWYQDCKQRCIEQMWMQCTELTGVGIPVVLELGLVQAADREAFYARADAADQTLEVYVLDVPVAVRQERVRARNVQQTGTYRMEVTDEVFELANRMWQPPDEVEIREREIQFVNSR